MRREFCPPERAGDRRQDLARSGRVARLASAWSLDDAQDRRPDGSPGGLALDVVVVGQRIDVVDLPEVDRSGDAIRDAAQVGTTANSRWKCRHSSEPIWCLTTERPASWPVEPGGAGASTSGHGRRVGQHLRRFARRAPRRRRRAPRHARRADTECALPRAVRSRYGTSGATGGCPMDPTRLPRCPKVKPLVAHVYRQFVALNLLTKSDGVSGDAAFAVLPFKPLEFV
jgi:hypothetical protein